MSSAETYIRPRLLFGRYLQAHCKQHDGSYQRSAIDLSEHLKNDNGNFTSDTNKSTALDFPRDSECRIHLDGTKLVAELPTKKRSQRNHASYDLDICLYSEDGKLKWTRHDETLGRDGGLTRVIEAIPGVGLIMALVHHRNNNPDHAKRALIVSSKGLFPILFSIFAMKLGNLNPSIVWLVAFLSFLGTIIADLTIETVGRAWIESSRVAADIPDRTWTSVFLDGLVAGAAVGAGARVAPHAEAAAGQLLRRIAILPEEIAFAELEILSIQNLMRSTPKLGGEVAKAVTGGVVRASSGSLQALSTQGSEPSGPLTSEAETHNVRPGRYYIAHAQTTRLLEFGSQEYEERDLQAGKPRLEESQIWIVETTETSSTVLLKSLASGEYVGRTNEATTVVSKAAKFSISGSHNEGFLIQRTDEGSAILGLDLDNEAPSALTARLGAYTGQKWLFEEAFELHRGPMTTEVKLYIGNVASRSSLRLDPPRKSRLVNRFFSKDGPPVWSFEAGFKGYLIKHVPSALYILAGSREQDVKTLPLTLGRAETEFILHGNDQNGYRIVYAFNPSYGLEVDADSSGTLLLWKPDTSHDRWRIEPVE